MTRVSGNRHLDLVFKHPSFCKGSTTCMEGDHAYRTCTGDTGGCVSDMVVPCAGKGAVLLHLGGKREGEREREKERKREREREMKREREMERKRGERICCRLPWAEDH